MKKETDESILTLSEAAKQFQVHKGTLAAMLRKGIIPARKVGREWRISKKAMKQWLEGETRMLHQQVETVQNATMNIKTSSVEGYKTMSFMQCVSATELAIGEDELPFLPREYATMILVLPEKMDSQDANHALDTFCKNLAEVFSPYVNREIKN
jgi:excisionase family DNA binding protein